MPSKGIECYTYNCIPSCSIELSVQPGDLIITKKDVERFTMDHLEVDLKQTFKNNGWGTFRCRVLQNGHEIFNKMVEISAWTGLLGKGDMKDLTDQTTVITGDLCISYGFYDAPAKDNPADLPKWDQFYVTISPNCSNWMSSVAPPGSPEAAKPFRRFVLPAAHDIGMNTMQTAVAILQRSGPAYLEVLCSAMPSIKDLPVSAEMKVPLVPNIIQSSSITQKDTLKTILSIGARYFEFRPAYIHKAIRGAPALAGIPDKLHFMHGPIPGMGYDDFLSDCVSFLQQNSNEIIVVQLRWDGVPKECAHPSTDELNSYLNTALKNSNANLQSGNIDDMTSKSTDQLRSENRRLIIIQDIDSYNIYSDQGNATLTGDSIVANYKTLTSDNQRGKKMTNIQCQATATNMHKIWFSALSMTASNSWLLCTKAVCDSKTLPWIRDNALESLKEDQLVVVMDDFFDGKVWDVVRGLCEVRLKAG